MKPGAFRTKLIVMMLGTGLTLLTSLVEATTLTWDADTGTAGAQDGTANWGTTTPAQWWNGAADVNYASGSDVVFGSGGTAGTVTLNADVAANSMTFNSFSGTYTFTKATSGGYTITLSGNLTMNSGAGAVTFSNRARHALGTNLAWQNDSSSLLNFNNCIISLYDRKLTFAGSGAGGITTGTGAISGVGGSIEVNMSGAGVVTLGALNTFTGGAILTAGTLLLANNNALGADGNTFTINGGTLDSTGATISQVQSWNSDIIYSGTSGNLTMQTGAITLDANRQVTVSANTLTVNNVVSDGVNTYSLTKAGNGTLKLGGANTFDGGVSLNAGTLSLGNDAALGTGTLTISGGSINVTAARLTSNNNAMNWNADFTFVGGNTWNSGTGAVTLGGNRQVTVSASTMTVGGIIDDGANSYSLTKAGGGTLTLTGANSYKGATTVNAGALNIRNNSGLGTTAGDVSVTSGAALQLQGAVTISNEALTLNGTGVSSDGALRNISDDNTYGGVITLSSAVRINSDSGTLTLNNATAITSSQNLTFGGSGNIAVSTALQMGGTSTVTKDGSGTVYLTGNNTYSGITTISDGVLDVGDMSSGALSANSLLTLYTGGILQGFGGFNRSYGTTGGSNWNAEGTLGFGRGGFSARGGKLTINSTSFAMSTSRVTIFYLNSATSDSELEWQSDFTLGNSARTITVTAGINGNSFATISGIISGGGVNGALIKAGNGLLVLKGVNTWTSTTTINAGTLVAGRDALVSQNGAFGNHNSALLLGNTSGTSAAALLTGGAFTIARAVTVQSGNTGVISLGGNTDNNSTFSGAISMNKDLSVTQVATTGANALQITGGISAGTAGTKTLTFNNAGNVTVGTTAIADGSGSISLVKTNSGTLALSAANTYTGTTTISASGGTLQLGSGSTGGSLNTASAISVGSGATFAINQSDTVTQGTDFSNSAISGAGGFAQIGTGTTVLNLANTYSGATTISAGILSISADNNLGTAPGSPTAGQLIVNGGTLSTSTGFTLSSNRGIALGPTSGSGGGTFDVANGQTLTYGGIAANNSGGTGSLTKSGAGTLSLSGNNTYSGTTTINAGTLMGVTGGSCSNSAVTVNANASLGVRVNDSTKQWTCASATVSTSTGTKLKFAFDVVPSTTIAAMRVTGNLVFTGTPEVEVDPANVAMGLFPLLVVEGTVPSSEVPTLTGVDGSLAWGGTGNKTLFLITATPRGTVYCIR